MHLRQTLLAMKLTTFFLILSLVQASARGYSQTVTFSGKDVTVRTVMTAIEKQTGFVFFYDANLLSDARPVTLNVKNETVETVLQKCLQDQPIGFSIENKTIFLSKRTLPVVQQPLPPPPIEVKGRVTDENGEPVAGATVTVKGTSNATATDASGNYVLRNVDEHATLVITGANIESYEMKVNSRVTVNAMVKLSVKEEEIVVAYGTRTKTNNVAAISVVKGEQIQNLPYRSVDKSLQGLVTGLQITGGTGAPGGGLSNMVIRGISTGTQPSFGSTVRNPLIVIDGIPVTQDHFSTSSGSAVPVTNPLAQFNPSDIETISVLKDAAAIALYGSKASNGVILITTKKGKSGRTVYSFRHQTGIASSLLGKLDVLSQDEWLSLLYATYKNTPRSPSPWTDALIKTDLISKFPTIVRAPGDTAFYPYTDWFDALYDKNAVSISNEFSMSGANEKNSFYLNLEHTDQNGTIKDKGYQRSSVRFNFETRPVNGLKFGFNNAFSYNLQDYDDQTESATTYGFAPLTMLNPVRDINGNYIITFSNPIAVGNPAAALEYNVNRHVAYRGLSKIYADLRLLKYFTLSSVVGVDYMQVETKEKLDPRLRGGSSLPVGTGRIYERDVRRTSIINTNSLRYDRQRGEHTIDVLAAQEAQIITGRTLSAEARGSTTAPPLPHYDQLTSPGYTMFNISGFKEKQTLLSLFGQVNYGFKKRYFLSTSLRGDGSSRFGDRNRWGTFWSAGAGWVMTEEAFMQSTTRWLDYLKLRGSVGIAGSSAAVNANTRYDLITNATVNGNPAFVISAPGNPGIQWEKTFTWDAGLEMKLFKDKVSLTADYYSKRTRDLIYPVALPSTGGYQSILDNIGNMNNHGWELSIAAWAISNKTLRWQVTANWSTNKNVLVKANVPLVAIAGNVLGNEEGRNFNSYFMPVWAGVNPTNGKPQWYNNAGLADTLYANAKKEFVGQPQPKGFGGITNTVFYKNFELSVFLYYQYGSRIYLADNSVNDGSLPYINLDRRALDYWQKPGDLAVNPRRRLGNSDGGNSISTRFLYSGDYLRLRNLSLAYNFQGKIIEKLHLGMLRIFVQGHNLAIITPFPGKDPDNMNTGGIVGHAYPNQRSYSAGINLNF